MVTTLASMYNASLSYVKISAYDFKLVNPLESLQNRIAIRIKDYRNTKKGTLFIYE